MYPELNNNCGCPDNTVPSVEIPAPPVCEGEPCPEIINTTCVRYDGPAIDCITTTVNMTLNALLVAITDKLCAMEAGGGTGEGAVTGVNWGCVTTPGTTSVSDAVQVLADAINANQISYNSSDFTVLNPSDCETRMLTYNKGTWIQIPNNNITFYNGFTAATPIYYLVDTDGIIHIKGVLSKPSVIDMSTATHPSGSVGIKLMDMPGYLLPVSERNTNAANPDKDYPIIHAAGFNNTCIYTQSGPVNPNYNLNWILSCGKYVSGGNYYFAVSAYVPYSATQNGGGNVGGQTNVSIYLHSLKYTSL
jgi:hypothetical protein